MPEHCSLADSVARKSRIILFFDRFCQCLQNSAGHPASLETIMEKAGYALLLIVAAAWLVAMIVGMVAAFPFGLLGLVALVGIGLLLIKVFREHLTSKEDRYYSKNIDK